LNGNKPILTLCCRTNLRVKSL